MFLQLLAENAVSEWTNRIVNAIDKILVPILIIGCSVGLIYAIVVGIKMMKADSKDARDENKARLINIAISIVAVVILIGLFYALRSWLLNEANSTSDFEDIFNDSTDLEGQTHIGGNLLNTFNLVKQNISMLF